MQEFITEAVVLNKEPFKDFDGRYSFFTKRFGKVVGKATSSRKITSKLAGHLEPGNLVQARFVERHGTQIVDVLKDHKLDIAFTDLRLLNAILHEGEPDPALWSELLAPLFSWTSVLRILGWDPTGAACEICGKKAAYFYIPRQEFFCPTCASKLGRNGLILLSHG